MSAKKTIGLSSVALAVLAGGYFYVIDQSGKQMEAAFSSSVEDISKGLATAFPDAHFGLLKVEYENTSFTHSEATTRWGDVHSGRTLLTLNHHINHGLVSIIETVPEMRKGSEFYRAIPANAVDKTKPLFTINTHIENLTGDTESHIMTQPINLSKAQSVFRLEALDGLVTTNQEMNVNYAFSNLDMVFSANSTTGVEMLTLSSGSFSGDYRSPTEMLMTLKLPEISFRKSGQTLFNLKDFSFVSEVKPDPGNLSSVLNLNTFTAARVEAPTLMPTLDSTKVGLDIAVPEKLYQLSSGIEAVEQLTKEELLGLIEKAKDSVFSINLNANSKINVTESISAKAHIRMPIVEQATQILKAGIENDNPDSFDAAVALILAASDGSVALDIPKNLAYQTGLYHPYNPQGFEVSSTSPDNVTAKVDYKNGQVFLNGKLFQPPK